MADISIFNDAATLEFFIELIEENKAAMNMAAHSVLRSEYSNYADDAVQNACISIAENINSIRNRLEHSKRRAYCVRVAKNKAIDIIRQNNKYDLRPLNDTKLDLVANTPDPLDEVLMNAEYERIISAINALDENYSSVLKYKLVDGFNDDEISKMLGITPKNVNVRTFRAKKKLRRLLLGDGEDEVT